MKWDCGAHLVQNKRKLRGDRLTMSLRTASAVSDNISDEFQGPSMTPSTILDSLWPGKVIVVFNTLFT